MNDKLTETFLEEAHELLEGLEDQLLTLEKDPANNEAMNGAFRALHSIKGSASMFGFDAVGAFAHEVEAALDKFRTEKIPATPELADVVLRSRDYIRALLDAPNSADEKIRQELSKALGRLSGLTKAAPVKKEKPSGNPTEGEKSRTFHISFKPSSDAYKRGVKPEALIKELRNLGPASIRANCQAVPDLDDLSPEECYITWNILLTSKASREAVEDVFIFEQGSSQIEIKEIDESTLIEGDEVKRLGEILAARKQPDDRIEEALSRQRPIGEILINDLEMPPAVIEDALFEQQHARNVVQATREDTDRKTIRIRSEKLDALLNLVGELITVQAQLSQATKDSGDRHLHGITDYVKRLASELRATSMEMRLVPVDSLFAKYKRLTRDLAKTLEKSIDLNLVGGDTEIDKSVVDALNDPLMHLVRNAADHGLERPDQRERAGKPKTGTITLAAQHTGAFVRITVKDDGNGLNHDKIFKRAVERGLVSSETKMTEDEISMLIFKPGFSTADVISSVSGRGVGLDVVKTAIDQLGGTLSVHSISGQGTEFILDIPLTLAIIDGFLVRAGARMFVIPLSSVDSCFERERPVIAERLIIRDGNFIPYVSSRALFGSEDTPPSREEVVIASVFESKLAIGFDQVLGGYQTVIKPLGEIARFANGISGAAILADGSIALILDLGNLAKQYRNIN